MTAVLLGNHAPGTDAWHQLRTQGLGGSEIAAVVGLSPFESAFGLWHRKAGNLPPQTVADFVEWGNRLEPIVAAHFALRHPSFDVQSAATFKSAERPWQMANPDRLLWHTGEGLADWELELLQEGCEYPVPAAILEVKTARYPDGWGESGSQTIPLHYRCQIMHYMDVLGVPSAHVAVLIGGNDYREYVIPYDADDAAALREAGAAFWASISADVEPPIDSSHETYEAVRELHPEIDGTDVALPPRMVTEYSLTKAEAEAATDAHRKAKSQILSAMGNARLGMLGDLPVLRRQPGRGGSVSLYPVKEAS